MTATDVVRRRIRALRERRGGMSAQDLANKCAKLGMPSLNRQTISNLENGRRAICTVDELLVLAAALDVPPVLLVTPPDPTGDERVVLQLSSEITMSAWSALFWISGETERFWPGLGEEGEAAEHRRAWRDAAVPVALYRTWLWKFEEAARSESQGGQEFERALMGLAVALDGLVVSGINPPPTPDDWVDIMRANGWLERPDEIPVQRKE